MDLGGTDQVPTNAMDLGGTDQVPTNANAGCVGPAADEAGSAAGCAGCPNQQLCASGEAKKEDPDVPLIAQRMASVKHKLLVLSGKGGVGKSTFSAQLAFALAAADFQVGLLDVDICGPSVPRMLGLEGQEIHQSNMGWSPVYVEDNLGVMSVGFMLPNRDDPVIWRGVRKNGLIKQFLRDTHWGELDFLIIDSPPGTSDEHISLAQYLNKAGGVDGCIVLTTPQEVSLLDVRKEINFCKKTHLGVLGVVENMSGYTCGGCGAHCDIFHQSTGGAMSMAAAMNVPFLGRVPLDSGLSKASEEGRGVTMAESLGGAAAALESIQGMILDALGEPKRGGGGEGGDAGGEGGDGMDAESAESFATATKQAEVGRLREAAAALEARIAMLNAELGGDAI